MSRCCLVDEGQVAGAPMVHGREETKVEAEVEG